MIAGPTGSGKTALGIEVAARLGGEIISADSMQVFRGMEIGTAAPTPDEQARVPHHLVSCVSPSATMAAGEYQRLGRERIAALHAGEKRAIVVGGSGLYIKALINGLFEGPPRQPALRDRLHAEASALGGAALMARLRACDPEYAAQLTSENDLIRIVRALEVFESTGRTFSAWHAEHQAEAAPLPARFFALQWDRAALYARIDARVQQMIHAGWLEEVQRLLDAGHADDLARIKALGYREIAAHLRGEQSLAKAIANAQMHHRRLAKRQLTWFRRDPRIHWLPAAGAEGEATRLAEAAIVPLLDALH